MDNGINLSPDLAQNLQNLSDKDKQDLNQFIMAEGIAYTMPRRHMDIEIDRSPGQKAQIQQTVHSLTDMCFKK